MLSATFLGKRANNYLISTFQVTWRSSRNYFRKSFTE